jgi:5-methyltetrahydrofolate--homocysteine methyltransferase
MMNPTSLLDAIKTRTLLCDGAMGTQLFLRGLAAGACGELWNIDNPSAVADIHRAYLQAGCDLITTNTFGGTRAALARHGLADSAAELNRAGARLARQAAASNAWVLGDIGPFGGFLEPLGDTTADQLTAMFREQAAVLYEGGVDAIIVETMSDPAEMAIAIKAAKATRRAPVIATYAFGKQDAMFRTMMGTTLADAIAAAIDAGADIVGANCGTALGLDDYLRLAEQLTKAAGSTPVILQPNAGSPASVDGKLVYPASPADMAALIAPLRQLGVAIIGGCCGTTPEHLKAMSQALRAQAKETPP